MAGGGEPSTIEELVARTLSVIRAAAGNEVLNLTTDTLRALLSPPPDLPPYMRISLSGRDHETHLADAIAAIRRSSSQPFPPELVPIGFCDERSFACAVGALNEATVPADGGSVVRWHLDDVPSRYQRQLLDVNPIAYLRTQAVDVQMHRAHRDSLKRAEVAYRISHGQEEMPKPYDQRVFAINSQNVVLVRGSFGYDSTLDGLEVRNFVTCQRPHVAAHEGTRVGIANLLCEAFRFGSTMEVRFDHHPEHVVPASIHQWARTVDAEVGRDDPKSISPAEARGLMRAASRADDRLERLMAEAGGLRPERVYFTILTGAFSHIEVEWLISCSSRGASILAGGTDPLNRPDRQAEMALARTALMLGMFRKVLSIKVRTPGERRRKVFEEDRWTIDWNVLDETGAVELGPLQNGTLPWARELRSADAGERITVYPRDHVTDELRAALSKKPGAGMHLALLPSDVDSDGLPSLHCPDTRAALDRVAEQKLSSLKVARA